MGDALELNILQRLLLRLARVSAVPVCKVGDGLTRPLFSSGSEIDPEGIYAFWEQSVPVSSELRDQLLANDFEAFIAASKGSSMRSDLRDDLPSMTMPFLLYGGEFDGNVEDTEYADRLPDATVVSLPGLDHIQGFRRSDLVLPHVKKFLARVSQA